MSARIAVVGAAGFVGRALVQTAVERGIEVRAVVRRRSDRLSPGIRQWEVGDLLGATIPQQAFEGCSAVINCAARVHVRNDPAPDPEAAFMAANCQLPLRLMEAAGRAGVSRFVQLSSVAAIASVTPPGETADDSWVEQPSSAYGRSKLAADRMLARAAADSGMSHISLRPPSVFGPGVGVYFRMLMKSAKLGLPLPIGRVRNRRSFIFVGNLADAIAAAAVGRHQGNFIVTDSAALSTRDLYSQLLRLYRRPQLLLPVAPALLTAVAGPMLGSRLDSIIGDACFDGGRFTEMFDWSPKVDFANALGQTVKAG